MFFTKDSHEVFMEHGCAQHDQPGNGWASLSGFFSRDKSYDPGSVVARVNNYPTNCRTPVHFGEVTIYDRNNVYVGGEDRHEHKAEFSRT